LHCGFRKRDARRLTAELETRTIIGNPPANRFSKIWSVAECQGNERSATVRPGHNPVAWGRIGGQNSTRRQEVEPSLRFVTDL
jgi:hypothetical protein